MAHFRSKFVLYLSLVVSSEFVCILCDNNLQLKDIVEASRDALDSGNVTKSIVVVEKYYFTEEKENSIWYHAQKESKEIFDMPLDEDNLRFIEKLILAAAQHYDHCTTIEPGAERAQCFYHLASICVDLEKGSRWISAPEISHLNRAKYGTVYNSVATLVMHLAMISKENFKYFDNAVLLKSKMHKYSTLLNNAMRMLFEYGKSVINTRTDEISSPTVCEINEYFWKEFEGICETRWRRSAAEDDDDEKQLNETDVDNVAVDDIEKGDFDVVSLEDDYESENQDTMLFIADRIGHSASFNHIKFRVQLHDNLNQKLVFEKYGYGEKSSRGEAIVVLAKYAMEARGHAAQKLRDKVTKFVSETHDVIWKVLLNILTEI